MKKFFLFLPLILLLSSCSTPNWYKPMGYVLFRQMPKGGTPGFNLGWRQGCESGLGTQYGGAFFMTFYTWQRDPDIASSNPDIPKIRARYRKELKDVNWDNPAEVKKNFSDYNTIFGNANSFCHGAALGILQSAGMHPVLPGQDRTDPMGNNFVAGDSIGNVWKMNAKGDTRIGTGFW